MASFVRGQDEPKSCAVIGYPSGQDSSKARDSLLCSARKQSSFLYQKFFIDQACSAKKERGQYPAILTSRLVKAINMGKIHVVQTSTNAFAILT